MTYKYTAPESVMNGTKTTATADDTGVVINTGFDTLTVPWANMQIWKFDGKDGTGMHPITVYNGQMQYCVAYSSGDIQGTNIRLFGGRKIKFMMNVERELFVAIAENLGKGDLVTQWEAEAVRNGDKTAKVDASAVKATLNKANTEDTEEPPF